MAGLLGGRHVGGRSVGMAARLMRGRLCGMLWRAGVLDRGAVLAVFQGHGMQQTCDYS